MTAPAVRRSVSPVAPSVLEGRCALTRTAGARPNATVVNAAAATVSVRTVRSKGIGTPSGVLANCIPHRATGRAMAVAAAASSALSTSSSRMTRPRPAPIASRMAISRCRCDPRAVIRFAALTQAIKRTSIGIGRMTMAPTRQVPGFTRHTRRTSARAFDDVAERVAARRRASTAASACDLRDVGAAGQPADEIHAALRKRFAAVTCQQRPIREPER